MDKIETLHRLCVVIELLSSLVREQSEIIEQYHLINEETQVGMYQAQAEAKKVLETISF
jgi:hypothetical protein